MITRATIGDATLLLADCRDILPSLGMVDVTITDPPYSAATHRGARTIRSSASRPSTSRTLPWRSFSSLPARRNDPRGGSS